MSSLGPWDPLRLDELEALFDAARFRWWVSGGHALELFAGRAWRSHADIDVSLLRSDAPQLVDVLAGWDTHVAAAGTLRPWDGSVPDPAGHQNNLWVRRTPADPWSLDVTIADGDVNRWVYRRDERVALPWEEAVLRTDGGTPFLAPDLQLLFKSKNVRPKDQLDAAEVIPLLDAGRRARLFDALDVGHEWREAT